jgi:hypothetical protein
MELEVQEKWVALREMRFDPGEMGFDPREMSYDFATKISSLKNKTFLERMIKKR